MKFLWYEDMKKDLIPVLRGLCAFTGRHLTEYRILKLDDFVYVDNFRYFAQMDQFALPSLLFFSLSFQEGCGRFSGQQ